MSCRQENMSKNLPKSVNEAISFGSDADNGVARKWVHPKVDPQLISTAQRAHQKFIGRHTATQERAKLPSYDIEFKMNTSEKDEIISRIKRPFRWEIPYESLPEPSYPLDPHGTRKLVTKVLPSTLAKSIVKHLYDANVCIMSNDNECLTCISPDGLVRFTVSLMAETNISYVRGSRKKTTFENRHDTYKEDMKSVLLEVRKLTGTSLKYYQLSKEILNVVSTVAGCSGNNTDDSPSLNDPGISLITRGFISCSNEDENMAPSRGMLRNFQSIRRSSHFGLPILKMLCFYTDPSKVGTEKASVNAVEILKQMESCVEWLEGYISSSSGLPHSEVRTYTLLALCSILKSVADAPVHLHESVKIDFEECLHMSLVKLISTAEEGTYDAMIGIKCYSALLSISKTSRRKRNDFSSLRKALYEAYIIGTLRFRILKEEAERCLIIIQQ